MTNQELPGSFTVADDWVGIEHAKNVLQAVKEGSSVTVFGRTNTSGLMGEVEPYAVILPVEEYRKLLRR